MLSFSSFREGARPFLDLGALPSVRLVALPALRFVDLSPAIMVVGCASLHAAVRLSTLAHHCYTCYTLPARPAVAVYAYLSHISSKSAANQHLASTP
jgi:hypothetical protein